MKIVTADFYTTAVDVKTCPADERPEIALAGRSNVGKSSLLNKLVNRKGLARTSNTPGRTQTINFFLINQTFYLVDLPGYGYAKVPPQIRAQWGPMVEKYLKERNTLKGVVQLVDIRHAPTQQDFQLCQWLQYYGIPFGIVATKCDKISKNQLAKQKKIIQTTMHLPQGQELILFSSVTGQGRDAVLSLFAEMLSV